MNNILTVDIEDWAQSTLDYALPIPERAVDNAHRLLDILAELSVRGTFFVQTLVAEKSPELIRRIAAEGHEIASHGHGHVPLFKLTPADFAEDLCLSLEILKQLGFHSIQGYRAPDFSIRKDTLWAFEILQNHGIRYSSSIYPFHGNRYGIPDIPVGSHQITDGLVEIPLSVVRLVGQNWPVAGGGYLRFLPYWITHWAIQRINAEGRPAVVYLHPYELDCQETREFRGQIAWRLYLTQSLNRHQTEYKLRSLLRDFEFAPVREVISL